MRRVEPWLMPATPDEGRMWLTWLVRLRWLALFAQAVTLAFVFHMLEGVAVIVAWVVTMAALALANVWAQARATQQDEVAPSGVLVHLLLDVAALTTFFGIGGGPDNPFVSLYFVHVAMAAVMLPPRYAFLVVATALIGYSATFVWHLPLDYDRHSLPAAGLHRLGQWLAFFITTTSVLVFVMGLAASLRRHKEQLLDARDRTARTDRLRSVGTLAAGAAHELNTPLSTLGLRLRRIRRRHTDTETERDLAVMQGQVDRCSSIVQRLLVGAGNPMASDVERRPLGSMVYEATHLWAMGTSLEVDLTDDSHGLMVELPGVAFHQALINLLENAREAQETAAQTTPLSVRVYREGEIGVVDIADAGCGLPQASDQVGEPFFTTKASGTGLGVFVARAVADGAGGGLVYLPRERQGTVARWWFPEARRKSA
jgi:two-component system sensor histidine kinase RegB